MITKTNAFIHDGTSIDTYTVTNVTGMSMEVTTLGGRILSLTAPDRDGKPGDVIVGYKTAQEYFTKKHAYFGAFIGRYGNRIGGAQFSIDGVTYKVGANEKGNSLHGGFVGYDMVVMTATIISENTLKLSYLSPDGEEGFPGNLNIDVLYTLSDDGELVLEYFATTDRDTVCNLTNHAYFNIGNDDSILTHVLDIKSSRITPTDEQLICHNDFMDIDGTPYSFKGGVVLGTNMFSDAPMIAHEHGFDFNYCIDRETANELEYCASVYAPDSGRFMQCYTTLPGVQLYTSNLIADPVLGTPGFSNYQALCLETQCYPNSPNSPDYPTTLLRVGEQYHTKTVYKFSVK